jgi:hypothetical protein
VVPGSAPRAGEPLIGVKVACGVTENVTPVATSPELPVTVSVNTTPPGTLPDTMKDVPVVCRFPEESIAHMDEANKPVGLEMNDVQAPKSAVEKGLGVARTVMVCPA